MQKIWCGILLCIIGISLSGCSGIPIKLITYTSEQDIIRIAMRAERNRILKIFSYKQRLILKACEKVGVGTFLASRWINEYDGSDIDEFLDYIYNNEVIFKEITRWSLERGVKGCPGLFSEIRSSYNLLEKIKLRIPMNAIERVREVIRKGNHTGKNLEAYDRGLNRRESLEDFQKRLRMIGFRRRLRELDKKEVQSGL